MKSVIEIPSSGNLLYGTVEYVSDRGLMVVLTSHRRVTVEITKRVRGRIEVVRSYLSDWEEVSPPRKLLAWQGRYSLVLPPKGAESEIVE